MRFFQARNVTLMAPCPECEAEIDVDEFDVDRGDQLGCPECGANLVVVSHSPVELDLMSEDDDEATAGNPSGDDNGDELDE